MKTFRWRSMKKMQNSLERKGKKFCIHFVRKCPRVRLVKNFDLN